MINFDDSITTVSLSFYLCTYAGEAYMSANIRENIVIPYLRMTRVSNTFPIALCKP